MISRALEGLVNNNPDENHSHVRRRLCCVRSRRQKKIRKQPPRLSFSLFLSPPERLQGPLPRTKGLYTSAAIHRVRLSEVLPLPHLSGQCRMLARCRWTRSGYVQRFPYPPIVMREMLLCLADTWAMLSDRASWALPRAASSSPHSRSKSSSMSGSCSRMGTGLGLCAARARKRGGRGRT